MVAGDSMVVAGAVWWLLMLYGGYCTVAAGAV